MKTEIKAPLFSNVSDKQFILNDFIEDLEDESVPSQKPRPKKETVYEDEKGIWHYDHPFCKHCGSRNVIKHGKNSKTLFKEGKTKEKIFVKRYKCNNCGKTSQTEFPEDYEPYSHYPKRIKEQINETQESGHSSLRKIVKNLKTFTKFQISHETVRKYQITDDTGYYLNSDIELSGYYGYDAQWFLPDKKWEYRMVILDLINNLPVAELVSKTEDAKTLRDFIDRSIPMHKRTAIVTDLKKDYDKVMRELGFDHQNCTYHLRLNINEQIRKHIQKTKGILRRNFKKENKYASKAETERYMEDKIEILKNEIDDYKALFFELFNQQTYSKALNYVALLKFEINNFPEPLKSYLIRNFFPEYKKFLVFLKKDHMGKLTATNNRTENYIGNIMPKALKNKFRTRLGFYNHIRQRIIGWQKNRKNPLTN